MNTSKLITKLEEKFKKESKNSQEEKDLAKENQRNRITSVLEKYYEEDSDKVEKANGYITEMFNTIARKSIPKNKTSPQDYKKSVYNAYFSDKMLKVLNREKNESYKRIYNTLFKSLKGTFDTNINDVPGAITDSLNTLKSKNALSPEKSTILPAVICYLLKLQNRIEKYNNMVEKANSGKKAEIDTGAKPLPKYKKQEREKENIDQDLDDDDLTSSQESSEDSLEEEGWEREKEEIDQDPDDDDLTSSSKSQDEKPAPPEDNPQQDGWELLGEDSLGIKKVPDADKVTDLNEYARSLRDLAENAKTIHSKTQTNYSGSGLEAGARDWGQRIKVGLWGKDSNNLVTISDKLNEIAGYIDNLKNDPKMGDISAANKVSTDTINLINEYKENKINKDGHLYQKKEDFVKTSREYLENIREVTEIYSDNKINEIADEISKEIDEISDPTNPSESLNNLTRLADIAVEIRKKTKNIQQAKDYAGRVPLFNCFDAALSKAKDITLAAENAVGYDPNNLQNISDHLYNIAKNDIQKSNYKTFKKDIEDVRALLNGYQTDKINNKKDALTDVRKKFIDKTTKHLVIVEGVSQHLTPEEKLKEIVARLSHELNEIDIQKNQMPAEYAKQLKQLANIGPEIRKETQDLQNYSNVWKSVTNSAQTLADMFTHINEDNISNISNNLNNIAKKIPDCKVDEINETESLVQKYAVKKSGVADDLSAIRSNFATKVTECLTEVKEITKAFNELKDNGEQNNKKIKDTVERVLLTVKKDKAQKFRNDIENKFYICQELESEKFIDDVLPSSSKMKKIANDIVELFTTGLKKTDSLFGWKKHVGNIFELVANKFLKGKNDTIKENIKKCFENINNTNKDGYPKTKCEEVLNNIDVWNNATFKGKIVTIQKMGDSYSTDLVQLKQLLGQIIYEFYGCNTKNVVSVPSTGADFSKFINIFSYQDLFSNVVSLYNNFDKEINDPIKNYPTEYLKSVVESNKQNLETKKTRLENTKTLWNAKKDYYELYTKIHSCTELLEKEELGQKGDAESIKEIFTGGVPKDNKDFSKGISNYLEKMNIKKNPGGIFTRESVTMNAKDTEGRKKVYEVLTACEREMEGRGFGNFDEEEYNNFKKSYSDFTENREYLEALF